MGFANDSYIVNETETEVKVCVSVVGGQLGTEVMLQLDTHSGTARGECILCMRKKYVRTYV